MRPFRVDSQARPAIAAPESFTKSGRKRAAKVDQRFLDMGASVLGSIIDWPAWIHRKVESIDLVPGDAARRRVSFDCTPPELADHEFPLPGSSGSSALVPLTLMAKQLLKTLDVEDDSGRSLPLVGSTTNATLAASALIFMAWIQLDGNHKRVLSLWPRIWEVVSGEPETASLRAAELVAELKFDSVAELIFGELASSFVLFVAIPRERRGERQVFKLSYRWRSVVDTGGLVQSVKRWLGIWAAGHGLKGVPFTLESGSMYTARSYHLEVVAPPGLKARSLELPYGESGEPSLTLGSSDVIHAKAAYSRFGNTTTKAEVVFDIDPKGAISHLFWTLVGISALFLALLAIPNAARTLLRSPDAATALLLFVPALLVALNARQAENVLAARLLAPLRVDAILISTLLFASGACLVLDLSPSFIVGLWATTFVLVSLLLATLVAGMARTFWDQRLATQGR